MSNGENETIGTANTMRERAGESRAKLWFLLEANRLAVVAILALFVFVALVAASTVLQPSLQQKIQTSNAIEWIFSSMIGVVVTGTTFVVTINQLVLSQETGPLGDQRKRMSDAMDYRTYASELFQDAPPAHPSELLQQLVRTSKQRAAALDRLVEESDDDELRRQVSEYSESLQENAEKVDEQLEGAEFGKFDVMTAALNFNYSWKIYQIERMTEQFDESLSDDEREAFARLRSALSMFGPAREHIKTLYFQWALVDLSQYILYVAVPAIVVSGCMLAFVGVGTFPGATLGIDNIVWVTAGAFTITVLPFLLFTSYVFRIATAAKRTLAIGPLVLRTPGE
ncbi:hypothetical protein [Halopelagius longus]|uniref:Uncharacterized protein n=1 Tax=Halopelagius longus TaxID=1236180 RepID=A0A1H1B8G3_9EURY|nr:hypothetical protein [Halopelagius longus]RDI70685.1 hypothetical protein DWB78_02500 [Halopelagius longus]SDQ48254.1 hypothetical protein SAMN05216278_1686 [Halopelagius longus]